MSTILLRETGSSPGSTVKGSPLTNAEIDKNFDAINKSVFDSVYDAALFPGVIVDTFIYDTTKDSDGGAWRHRCSHTSWENETLVTGKWLGSAASEAAARAISGAVDGDYFYDNTTELAFYKLDAGSGVTQVYRGNTRKLPAKVLITVEAARVVIWDLTQAGCPMWMVFVGNGSATNILAEWVTGSISCVAMLNGKLVQGHNTYDVGVIDFVADAGERYSDTANNRYKGTIAGRNSTLGTSPGKAVAIVNRAINDVAMFALPNAPVDVATGLPIPVIDVFTDAGTSRINTDGTVADLADTAGDDHKAGCILASGDSVGLNSTNGNVDIYKLSNTLADTLTPDRTYDQATVPALLEAVDAGDKVVAMKHRFAVGQDNGVNVLIENPASVAAGMIAYITKDYNSGWQVGAIKGAWLADTVAETVTGTELVTNGTFATDTTGWTAVNSSLASVSGELQVTNSGTNFGYGYQAITTVVGKTYVASCLARQSTSANVYFKVGVSAADATNGIATTASGTNVPLSVSFVATAATTYLTGQNNNASGGIGYFDNITCRLADVDRSVKAKGLQAFGSLTKAAVASGAALMGYSGFSAANYLEQPYNSDLDFGTGDFCVMGWAQFSSLSAASIVFQRALSGSSGGIVVYVNADGVVFSYLSTNTTTTLITNTANGAVVVNVPRFIAMRRLSGVLQIFVNAVSMASAANTTNLTYASTVTRIGLGTAGTNPTLAALSLWRATATAPSDEQIKHIYETEKALFEANASCVLAGSSNAVTALAYDDETDLLHVGTSYGRSTFKGLTRVSSEATAIGAFTALSASGGIVAQGGATAADIYIPAYTLRDELSRRAEQAAKLNATLEPVLYTATISQTAFQLAVNWTPKYVYRNNMLLREGATEDYTLGFDGFRWTVTLAEASVVNDHVTILGIRTNG